MLTHTALWRCGGTMLAAFFCAALATLVGGLRRASPSGYSRVAGSTERRAFVMRVIVVVPAIVVLGFVATRYRLLLTPFQTALWLSLILWPGVARVVSTSVAVAPAAGSSLRPPGPRVGSAPHVVSRHVLPSRRRGRLPWRRPQFVAQSTWIVATVQYLGYCGIRRAPADARRSRRRRGRPRRHRS